MRVRCGGWSGYGLWDAERQIAIRIFSERQVPDARWLRERSGRIGISSAQRRLLRFFEAGNRFVSGRTAATKTRP